MKTTNVARKESSKLSAQLGTQNDLIEGLLGVLRQEGHICTRATMVETVRASLKSYTAGKKRLNRYEGDKAPKMQHNPVVIAASANQAI